MSDIQVNPLAFMLGAFLGGVLVIGGIHLYDAYKTWYENKHKGRFKCFACNHNWAEKDSSPLCHPCLDALKKNRRKRLSLNADQREVKL